MERSSEEKVLGGITHIALLFSWIGLIANVVIFVIYRPKSAFVAGHAKQALGLQVLSMLLSWVFALVFGVGMFGLGMGGMEGGMIGAAVVGGLLAAAVGIAVLVLAILGAVKGFQGHEWRHPVIGDFVAKIGE